MTQEQIDKLMQVTDLVMLDIKHIQDAKHRELTGHSNSNILAFARFLDETGSRSGPSCGRTGDHIR